MADYPLSLVGPVPECWPGGQAYAEALAAALLVNINIGSVIIGQNEPSADERAFLWVRINPDGSQDANYLYWTGGPAGAGWYRKEPYIINEVKIFESNTPPSPRWQFCDGTNGSLNYRSRAVGCTGDGGAGLSNRTLGQVVGAETHALVEAENGRHNHNTAIPRDRAADAVNGTAITCEAGFNTEWASDFSGLGTPHNNMQPTIFIPMYKYIGPQYVLAGVA